MTRARRIVWVGAFLLLALVLLRLLIFRPSPTDQVQALEVQEDPRSGQAGHNASPTTPARQRIRPSSRQPGADQTTESAARGLRQLTGYLVDDFRGWTSIPSDYQTQGLELGNGGLTIQPALDPEQNRTGILLSPPLRLRPPPGGRPDSPGRELPPGSSLDLEIRLSRDGTDWTGWSLIERFRNPDGPYVTSPAPPDPKELEVYRDATTTGPSIQYRLTLTVGAEGPPVIRDLRIWHEGPAQFEQELSIHSPPKPRG